eukprot:CAMPEP_0201531118 /NCGR_PEP_ID=MMETSP0161_2-20130828/46610_1 /ASSEMBLY_ACC=CAM_ASM_000251 /TAXON_ID=180227 /ORGANISM="Neoparamoeba aestuarina, Strain SoJaBio B1-5/56/2" /LENGTH=242 /DNA_ID=CAMNT_0047933813 /DNA_START=439 /DNA_END=1164 /DNA_ORIENTATION=-
MTSCTAVSEGYSLTRKSVSSRFGGDDTTNLLQQLYPEATVSCKDFFFSHQSDTSTGISYFEELYLRKLKREILEVSCSSAESTGILRGNEKSDQRLPDGSNISIGVEKYLLTEPLFVKDRQGNYDFEMLAQRTLKSRQRAEMMYESMQRVHFPSLLMDLRSSLDDHLNERVGHTVMTCGGGISFIKNFNQRLDHELRAQSRSVSSIDKELFHSMFFTSSPHALDSAWVGASVLSSIPGFSEM